MQDFVLWEMLGAYSTHPLSSYALVWQRRSPTCLPQVFLHKLHTILRERSGFFMGVFRWWLQRNLKQEIVC